MHLSDTTNEKLCAYMSLFSMQISEFVQRFSSTRLPCFVMLFLCELEGPTWAVGRCSSGPPSGGIPQILIVKTLRTAWPLIQRSVKAFLPSFGHGWLKYIAIVQFWGGQWNSDSQNLAVTFLLNCVDFPLKIMYPPLISRPHSNSNYRGDFRNGTFVTLKQKYFSKPLQSESNRTNQRLSHWTSDPRARS